MLDGRDTRGVAKETGLRTSHLTYGLADSTNDDLLILNWCYIIWDSHRLIRSTSWGDTNTFSTQLTRVIFQESIEFIDSCFDGIQIPASALILLVTK